MKRATVTPSGQASPLPSGDGWGAKGLDGDGGAIALGGEDVLDALELGEQPAELVEVADVDGGGERSRLVRVGRGAGGHQGNFLFGDDCGHIPQQALAVPGSDAQADRIEALLLFRP